MMDERAGLIFVGKATNNGQRGVTLTPMTSSLAIKVIGSILIHYELVIFSGECLSGLSTTSGRDGRTMTPSHPPPPHHNNTFPYAPAPPKE